MHMWLLLFVYARRQVFKLFFEIFFKKKFDDDDEDCQERKKIVMHQTDTFFLFVCFIFHSFSLVQYLDGCVCVKIISILNKCRSCYMWIVRIHYVFFLDDDNDQEMTPWILFQKEWFSLAFFKTIYAKFHLYF